MKKKHVTLTIDEEVCFQLSSRKDIGNLSALVENFLRAVLIDESRDVEEEELLKQQAAILTKRHDLDTDLGLIRAKLGNLQEKKAKADGLEQEQKKAMNAALLNTGMLRSL